MTTAKHFYLLMIPPSGDQDARVVEKTYFENPEIAKEAIESHLANQNGDGQRPRLFEDDLKTGTEFFILDQREIAPERAKKMLENLFEDFKLSHGHFLVDETKAVSMDVH